jgi:RNA polymerase sigma-70 factor (ECF subfamily)
MPETSSSHGTSLIVRLRDNDSIAWNELVELYGPLVFHWCAESRLQSSDSADVMQEVFASAAKSIHRFEKRAGSSLRGWLWTITRNKIRDFVRKQTRQVNGIGGTEANIRFNQVVDNQFDSTSLDVDELTGELETSRLVHRALQQIKGDFQTHTWTAFWRSAIDGQDTNSIAAELDLSPNSVRQAKSRVLRRLREQLGDV